MPNSLEEQQRKDKQAGLQTIQRGIQMARASGNRAAVRKGRELRREQVRQTPGLGTWLWGLIRGKK